MKKNKILIDENYKRELILQHYENPINKIEDKKVINDEYITLKSVSVSCIDNFDIFIKFKNDKIADFKFFGNGCAISTSSIDIMGEILKKNSLQEDKVIIDNYLKMVVGDKFDGTLLGVLLVFANVYKQANRIKCATIGIETIKDIINKYLEKKEGK
ncbi:MAG: iron-sulfur cluster assembly scaffold protein [Mycoplasmataceae bacterium]|jgi:nitrogen fixation NifU-like protein|nr:iron-sulfur cluster assembly scaffold protein [Mycoplasmataceae bacterium]